MSITNSAIIGSMSPVSHIFRRAIDATGGGKEAAVKRRFKTTVNRTNTIPECIIVHSYKNWGFAIMVGSTIRDGKILKEYIGVYLISIFAKED